MIGVRECWGCILLCLCGLAIGSLAGQRFSWIGFLLGSAVGSVGAFLLFHVVVSAYVHLEQAGPCVPPCHSGRCKGGRTITDDGDYEWLRVDDDVFRRCNCGCDYVMTDAGRRFMERLPGGTLMPHMVHRPFRGWFRDSEEDG